jgi:hypothetical protein
MMIHDPELKLTPLQFQPVLGQSYIADPLVEQFEETFAYCRSFKIWHKISNNYGVWKWVFGANALTASHWNAEVFGRKFHRIERRAACGEIGAEISLIVEPLDDLRLEMLIIFL